MDRDNLPVWSPDMVVLEEDPRTLVPDAGGGPARFRFSAAPVFPVLSGTVRSVSSSYYRGRSLVLVDAAGALPDPAKRGEDVVVIAPGSRYLRIGLASQGFPRTVAHVIARRLRSPGAARAGDAAYCSLFDEVPLQSKTGQRDEQLAWIDNILRDRLKTFKKKAAQVVTTQIAEFNAAAQPQSIPEHSDPQPANWSDAQREVYVGEEALRLPSYEHYRLFFPMQHGHLNLGEAITREAGLNDLEHLWTAVIEGQLKLPRAQFGATNAILVLPDGLDRSEAEVLTDLLLSRMGFRAVMLQQASVCAAFGAGLASALVVDVGAQSMSVACVDEGISLPSCRIALPVGSDDTTRLLHYLLRTAQFPYASCRLASVHDFLALEAIKERYCTCVEAEVNVVTTEFNVRRQNKPTLQYPFKMFDQIIKAPLVIFHPLLLEDELVRRQAATAPGYNAADYMDEALLNRVAPPPPKHAKAKPADHARKPPSGSGGGAGAGGIGANVSDNDDGDDGDDNDDDLDESSDTEMGGAVPATRPIVVDDTKRVVPTLRFVLGDNGNAPSGLPRLVLSARPAAGTPPPPPVSQVASQPRPAAPRTTPVTSGIFSTSTVTFPTRRAPPSIMGLDEAISTSIQTLDEERQRRMLTSILLVGGGTLVPGLIEVLDARLVGRLGERDIQIAAHTRDVDPRLCAWKGASILGRLETNRDTWISSAEWQTLGIRMLREKSYFEWF